MYGRNFVQVHMLHKPTGATKIKTFEAISFKRHRKEIEDGDWKITMVAPMDNGAISP